MKNRILSSLLVVVMLLGAVIGLIPVQVEAAHSPSVGTSSTYTASEIKKIVQASYEYKFNNAAEMLTYELGLGYLDSVNSKGNVYTLYVNRYTGCMYYVNNSTGQILTSNPYNPGLISALDTKQELMNQITVAYLLDTGELTVAKTLLGSRDAAERAQITVSQIAGGLRVNYTLGDTSTRFIVPMQITTENYYEYVLNPMLKSYETMLEMYVRESMPDAVFDFYGQDSWGKYGLYNENGYIELRALQQYIKTVESYYKKYIKQTSPVRAEFVNMNAALSLLTTSFNLIDPAKYDPKDPKDKETLDKLAVRVPLSAEGIAVYECSKLGDTVSLRRLQNYLSKYTGYSIDLLDEHETECRYTFVAQEHPVFRCSLEYSFADDGSLTVRLPANSIAFDETVYNLEYIAPLKFFGAGNLKEDGYVFLPDGSGSIIDFEDFYNEQYKQNVSVALSVYGDDYAFSTPTGYHKEQVIMPVFGMVSKENASSLTKFHSEKDKLDSGFFAILEEGASLANLNVNFGGTAYAFATAYASYQPFPSDKYQISSTSSATYTLVSDCRYSGSYVTRYVMLGDTDLVAEDGSSSYHASYVGMATYYRDYLKAKGEISALEAVEETLPLYIEALGSMNIVEKILTFPVTVSKPLTTFEDIITMYDEFSDAEAKFNAKAAEYDAKAKAETKNAVLQEKYQARADQYRELAKTMKSITNINFKLTGFANGGMYYTYPSSVKWESSLGGDAGLATLINASKDRGSKAGYQLGVFPEFDFLYMSNPSLFDGISENTDLSRMVDNRFASKKVYNSVLAIYESVYSMVISSDALDKLYTSFSGSYSLFGLSGISLSTVGSDLNSNFDEDNPINREESVANIVGLLDRISNESGYDTMVSVGNVYSVKYADHIINLATDSSHLSYSSYAIPFVGLVLHSYVNYAGTPLNYAGSPDYDILRAIENGASLYYILCYQNTEFMKEDGVLNDYYGVDYINWYDKIIEQYNILNGAIGGLQDFEIVDHKVVLAERIIDENEARVNREALLNEFVELVDATIYYAVNDAFDEMHGDATAIGRGVCVSVDLDTLVSQASLELNVDKSELLVTGTADAPSFYDKLAALATKYENDYPADANAYQVSVSSVDYVTKFDYVTDSTCYDGEEYDYTDYTVDNKRVVVVTYKNATTGETETFVLNYNIYGVKVRLDANTVVELGKYGFDSIKG